MIVEIKPIEREKWHGYKKADDFSRDRKIFPVVDPNTRKYKTGLDEDDIEKLKAMGFKRELNDDWKRYEPHPFWDSTEVKVALKQHTFRLDTDNPIEFIQYKYILEHPAVANSLREYEEGKWPDATHYIVNSPDAIRRKASEVEARKQAYGLLLEASRDKKLKVALLVGGKDFSKEDDKKLEIYLDELLSQKPRQVLKYLSQDDELSDNLYIVKKALRKKVLRNGITGIKFMDLLIGTSEEEAALFLGKEDNLELKERLLEQIKD